MAVTRKHSLYAVQIGSTLLGGITQQRVQTGTEVRGEATSGEVYNRTQSITAQKPSANFTTLAIATALDAVGLTGVDIAGLSGYLNFYAQQHADGGTRAGAGSHRKYTIRKGIIVPRLLQVSHQQDATIAYDVTVTYDGVNDPITITDSVSLPTGITDAERFTLGPIRIGNIALAQARSFEIDFGITVQSEGAESSIWDTFASIVTIAPRLTLRGIDIEWFKAANIPLLGKAAIHTDTKIYLRKRASGGTYVADAVAQHISFTADGLAYIDTVQDANGQDPSEVMLVMPLRYDGTNAPLVINTATTIT